MEQYIIPSAIAMLTSFLVSFLSYKQFIRSNELQQKQFDRSFNRALTTKLYDLRLNVYPRALEITDKIHKAKGGNYDSTMIQEALEELIEWKKGLVDLIISVEALESFFELRDVLMKNPETQHKYSSVQVENISNKTKNFRRQLRRDIGFLFREEKERRKQ